MPKSLIKAVLFVGELKSKRTIAYYNTIPDVCHCPQDPTARKYP